MTDKQINTCEFLNICQTNCNGTLEDTEICHCYELYKKLKRKEQECKELKEEQAEIKKYLGISHKTILERLEELTEFRDRDGEEIFQLKEQLDQLKAENKELKQYKTLYEKTRNLWNKARMNNYELLDEIKDLKDSLKRTVCQSECYKHKEADKLKQTLTEIKEIAEKHKATAHCDYLTDMDIILKKISEVKDDRQD